MKIYLCHFIASHSTKGRARFFDKEVAKKFAEGGVVVEVETVYIYKSIEDYEKFQASLKKIGEVLAYLDLPGLITDKGSDSLLKFITRHGKPKAKKLLKSSIADLGFSTTLTNALNKIKKKNLVEVLSMESVNDFLKYRDFGKKCATELTTYLDKNCLEFGMFQEL